MEINFNEELLMEAIVKQTVADLGTLTLLEEAGLGDLIIGEELPDLAGLYGTVHSARVRTEKELRSMLDRWCPSKDTDELVAVARKTARREADEETVHKVFRSMGLTAAR